jgi:hypothetical protein
MGQAYEVQRVQGVTCGLLHGLVAGHCTDPQKVNVWAVPSQHKCHDIIMTCAGGSKGGGPAIVGLGMMAPACKAELDIW